VREGREEQEAGTGKWQRLKEMGGKGEGGWTFVVVQIPYIGRLTVCIR
jgi:hypothetical protein